MRTGDVDPWWTLLAADLDTLRRATMPSGVRILPPRDPYLQMQDRETIVDKAHHRDIWRATGAPGTVLADGEVIGTWRPRKSGQRLRVELEVFEAFEPLSRDRREELVAEAESIAPLRNATSVSVDLTTG